MRLNKKYGAARADMFRYLILSIFGGVYLDIKTVADSLDILIHQDDGFIVSKWSQPISTKPYSSCPNFPFTCTWGEYQQFWIASVAKHPILTSIMERVQHNINILYNNDRFPPGKDSVLRITGPVPYTEAIDTYIANGGTDVRITCPNGNSMIEYTQSPHETIYNHYSLRTDPIVLT